jgi:hypothetical protein
MYILKMRKHRSNKGGFNISREEILIFKENNISRNMKFVTAHIITTKTFVRNTITEKYTFSRLSRKFVSFMRRQIKANITKSMQIMIVMRLIM